MKKFVLSLLAMSVVLNLALAVLFVAGSDSKPTPGAGVAGAPAAKKPSLPAIDASIWPSLEAEALLDLVRNLREPGFPPGRSKTSGFTIHLL